MINSGREWDWQEKKLKAQEIMHKILVLKKLPLTVNTKKTIQKLQQNLSVLDAESSTKKN
jgi:hypothetical protein